VGIVSNGRQLPLLCGSARALATVAYVEFDLEAIFDGELFRVVTERRSAIDDAGIDPLAPRCHVSQRG
jgi:hypothetical protein